MRVLTALLLMVAATAALAAPVVWQVNDPVNPGETAVLFGDGFGERPPVSMARLSDNAPGTPGQIVAFSIAYGAGAAVLQASDQCLKVLIASDLKPGLFRLLVGDPQAKQGATTVTLNRPTLWWNQLDWSDPTTVRLRLFGKNLAGPATQVYLKGPKTLALPIGKHEDTWAAAATLPANLPEGDYKIFYHSGYGGPSGWSEAASFTFSRPRPWPATVYKVSDFGADGSATRDDTNALQAALDKAGGAGGGVVFLPRGRYQLSTTLKLPRFVTLRGEASNEVALFWPDMPTPPNALLEGANSFAVENLTIYASNARHIIVGDTGEKLDAGNVRLFRVRTRVDAYRGHLEADEVDRRNRDLAKVFGGDSVRLGGDNIRILQCDLYGSGRALYLSRTRGGVVRGNAFYNGRHGWYCISGSDGLIFEDNTITGADLMATGGGLNCLDGSSYSQNVYYARNKLSLMHGWDREAMTSDAGGGLYYGPLAKAEGVTLTLPETPKLGRNWEGAAVFVFAGKGWTQMRRVVKVEGATVTVDRPWDVPPDSTSLIGITMLQRHYIVADNSFSDAGIAVQFYGTSYEHIVTGNTCARAGGYQGIGKPYGGYNLPPDKNPCHQPSWFCQFVDNTIAEGSIYRSGANNSILSGDSVIGVFGWPLTRDWPWPYNVGTVVRRNALQNHARLHLGGNGNDRPSVSDAIVEGNMIRNATEGVRLDRATRGILLRANTFANVATPLGGDGLDRALLAAGQLAAAEAARLQAAAEQFGVTTAVADWPEIAAALKPLTGATAWTPEARTASAEATAALLSALAKRKVTLAPETLAALLGLTVSVDEKGSTLPGLLQKGGGGVGSLKLDLAMAQPVPGCSVALDLTAPWSGSAPAAVLPSDGKLSQMLTVQLPAAAWGRTTIPAKVTLTLPQAVLPLTRNVVVGNGVLREWMLLGPLPNKSGQPLDLTLYAPEDALNIHEGVEQAKWQVTRLGGDWIDFGRLYGQTSGVAYAVACVTAEKETSATLLLGSSGGVGVSLNGSYLWSSNQSRNPAPAQDRVPLTLRAGDNVLLLKSSNISKDWKLHVELVPQREAFASTVSVVPAAQFVGKPCFAAPKPRPAVEAGEVRFAAGVDWKLVYADDFNTDVLSGRWRPAVGQWTAGQGFLRSGGDRCFLAYAEKLPAPVRIEYDTRTVGGTAGDLSPFWLSDPTNYSTGYLIGFGSNGNTCNKVLVEGSEVVTATRPVVTPGKWHHVIAQVLANGRVQLIIDEQLAIDHQGPPPGAAKQPGLWTWGPEGVFSKVRIYAGK